MLILDQQINFLLILGGFGMVTSFYFDVGEKPVIGEYLGAILLEEAYIKLINNTIHISEIKSLSISFNTYKNEKHYTRFGYYLSSGTENTIKLQTKDITLSYNFMVLNPNHKTDIIEVLSYYYKQGLFVGEYGNGRTYLGKSLTYEEIQEFKKKYNLKGTGYQ
jgi:hypothetical protein